jgi:hypothetical protein
VLIRIFGAEQQVWLLANDEIQGRNAVNTLLSLLILSEGVVFEKAFQPGFGDDADQRDKLWIRFVGAWML